MPDQIVPATPGGAVAVPAPENAIRQFAGIVRRIDTVVEHMCPVLEFVERHSRTGFAFPDPLAAIREIDMLAATLAEQEQEVEKLATWVEAYDVIVQLPDGADPVAWQKRHDRAHAAEVHERLKRELAMLTGAFPGGNLQEPQVYGMVVLDELMELVEEDGLTVCEVASACRTMRKTLSRPPAIPTLLAAVKEARAGWRDRYRVLGYDRLSFRSDPGATHLGRIRQIAATQAGPCLPATAGAVIPFDPSRSSRCTR